MIASNLLSSVFQKKLTYEKKKVMLKETETRINVNKVKRINNWKGKQLHDTFKIIPETLQYEKHKHG